MFNNIIKNQKGITLTVAFFVMTIMLVIVLTLTVMLFDEFKITNNIGNSVSSFYSAESGLEKTLYYDRKQIPGGAERGFCDICNSCSSLECASCVATPLEAGGCDPNTCNNCQITYNTVFGDRSYVVDARVYPDPLNIENLVFSLNSKGFYKDTTRAVELRGAGSGGAPGGPGFGNTFAYSANLVGDTIQKFDAETLSVITSANVNNPFAILAEPGGNHVYVLNQSINAVEKRLAADLSQEASTNTDGMPVAMALSADGSFLYVVSVTSNSLEKFDTVDLNKIGSSAEIFSMPGAVAVSPDGNYVYVVSYNSGTGEEIKKFNASDLSYITTGSTTFGPLALAVSLDGNYVYVMARTANALQKLDATNFAEVFEVNVGMNPSGMALSSNGNYIYVVNEDSNTLQKFNASDLSQVGQVSTGTNPQSVAVSIDGNYVYVVNKGSDTIQKFNAADLSEMATGSTDDAPQSVSVYP